MIDELADRLPNSIRVYLSHVEIGQSGNPGGPTWRAECSSCGTTWDFDDD